MSLCLVQSRALVGLEAAAVTVEVHLANGLPNFTLVGLADTEVKEARVSRKIPRAQRSEKIQRAFCARIGASRHFPAHPLCAKNFSPAN